MASEPASAPPARVPPDSLPEGALLLTAANFVTTGRLWLVLAASWLLGLAHLALLPPYEGFDEIAHHATIQQVAAATEVPWPRDGRVSREVEAYLRAGPSVYLQLAEPLGGRGHDLHSFFADPEAQAETRRVLSATPAPPFEPGVTPNWELQQHPPLYYLAMAPIERALAATSLQTRLLALRLASWSLAVLGLAVAAAALTRHGTAAGVPHAETAALLAAAWPFVMPMALPEFARLGNDSLCILLLATAFSLLLRMLGQGATVGRAVTLGIVLGLGLLTKAWFIAVTAGLSLFLLAQGNRRSAAAGVTVGVTAAAIGGGWYLGNLRTLGNLSGSLEVSWLDAQGGLAAGLAAHFSWLAWARGIVAAAASFVWSGTQSLARLPHILLAVPVALVALVLAAYLARLPRFRAAPAAWLPVFVIAPMAAALAYHALVRVALTGIGSGTPGWYLHVFAPFLAIAADSGMVALWRQALGRAALTTLATGAALYFVMALASQLALFAGCVPRDDDGRYRPLASIGCLAEPGVIYQRLELIAWPALGFAAFACALVLVGVAAWQLRRASPYARG